MRLSEKDRRILNHLPPEIGNMKLGDILGALVDACSYSETPQRIGTWVDGTPVWRQAFMIYCKDMGAEAYGYMIDDKLFTATPILKIKSQDGVYVLGSQCTFSTGMAVAVSIIDDVSLMREQYPGNISFIIPDSVISQMPESRSEDMPEGFYGYVDFATPESNIDTGDGE